MHYKAELWSENHDAGFPESKCGLLNAGDGRKYRPDYHLRSAQGVALKPGQFVIFSRAQAGKEEGYGDWNLSF
jgi:hypothetical protein